MLCLLKMLNQTTNNAQCRPYAANYAIVVSAFNGIGEKLQNTKRKSQSCGVNALQNLTQIPNEAISHSLDWLS